MTDDDSMRMRNDIMELESALKLFVIDAGKCPARDVGLRLLIDGKYIDNIPKDNWGSNYELKCIDLERMYVYSPGPNRRPEQCKNDDFCM